jgi:hypothetical protein
MVPKKRENFTEMKDEEKFNLFFDLIQERQRLEEKYYRSGDQGLFISRSYKWEYKRFRCLFSSTISFNDLKCFICQFNHLQGSCLLGFNTDPSINHILPLPKCFKVNIDFTVSRTKNL